MGVFARSRLGGFVLLLFYLIAGGSGSAADAAQQPSIWVTNPPLEEFSIADADGSSVLFTRSKSHLHHGFQAVVYPGTAKELSPPGRSVRVAIRVIWKNPDPELKIEDWTLYELLLQANLDHDNVLGLINIFQDENYFYAISQLADEKDLMHALMSRRRSFSEIVAEKYFRQVLSGLVYLHSEKIIHRDIKLENIVKWKSGLVKIADFGFAIKLDSENNNKIDYYVDSIDIENGIVFGKRIVGTPYYVSPEICSEKMQYSYQSDVYAMGVLLFVMLTRSMPEEQVDCSKEISPDYIEGMLTRARISRNGIDLVKQMLKGDPGERITLDGVVNHAWLARDVGSMHSSQRPIGSLSNQENQTNENDNRQLREINEEEKVGIEVEEK